MVWCVFSWLLTLSPVFIGHILRFFYDTPDKTVTCANTINKAFENNNAAFNAHFQNYFCIGKIIMKFFIVNKAGVHGFAFTAVTGCITVLGTQHKIEYVKSSGSSDFDGFVN